MRLLWGCILIFLISSAISADVQTIYIDPGQDKFSIQLTANPTTGYQWNIERYDKTLLQLSNSEYIPLGTNMIGSGGKMVFTFSWKKRLSSQGTCILFHYVRTWESKGGTYKKILVRPKKK